MDPFKSVEEKDAVFRLLNDQDYLSKADAELVTKHPSYPLTLTNAMKGTAGLARECKVYGLPLIATLTRAAITISEFEVFDGAAESLLHLNKKLSLYVSYTNTFSEFENQRATGLAYLSGLNSVVTLERGKAMILDKNTPPDHVNAYLNDIAETDLPVAKEIAAILANSQFLPEYLNQSIKSINNARANAALYESLPFDPKAAGYFTAVLTDFTPGTFDKSYTYLKAAHEDLLYCMLTTLTNLSNPEARALGLTKLGEIDLKFALILARSMTRDPSAIVQKAIDSICKGQG